MYTTDSPLLCSKLSLQLCQFKHYQGTLGYVIAGTLPDILLFLWVTIVYFKKEAYVVLGIVSFPLSSSFPSPFFVDLESKLYALAFALLKT